MAQPRMCCATTPTSFLPDPSGSRPQSICCAGCKRNVVVVPQPPDLEGVRAAVRTVAAAVGEKSKGEAMIAAFDRRLAGLSAAGRRSAAHGNHLPGRRIGLGPRQPGGGGARGGRISQQGGRIPPDPQRTGAARTAGGCAAGPARAVERRGRVSHRPRRQSAPSGAAAPAAAPCLAGTALAVVAVRHATYCRRDRALGSGTKQARGARAMSLMPARASAEIAPPYLLGVLGAAAVVAFLISLAVGPSGFGFGHGAGLRRSRFAHLLGDPSAARDPGCACRRGARPLGRGAAGLPAQPAGRAEPGRRFGRRGAGGGAGNPSRVVAGARPGAAGRRVDRRGRRDAGRGRAGRRAWRAGDADPCRARRVGHRDRADLAGPQPVAESVCLRRDGVLADGVAGRSQPDSGVAGGAADAGRHGRVCFWWGARWMR